MWAAKSLKNNAIKTCGGWRNSYTINFGTRRRWVASFTRRPLHHRWKNPRCTMYKRLSGPQKRSRCYEEKKNMLPQIRPIHTGRFIRRKPRNKNYKWRSNVHVKTKSGYNVYSKKLTRCMTTRFVPFASVCNPSCHADMELRVGLCLRVEGNQFQHLL
jgi:hypothetical protein